MKTIKIISEKKNKIVTRRNDLIEARFRLTLQEQRLMYWVMSCIEPDDDDFKTYRISISELSKVIGTKDKDIYGRLKEITKRVMGRIIELKSGDTDILIPLINKAIYHKGKGIIDIRLDEDLKKYLLQIKGNFTSVKVAHLFALSSTYSMRIYELLAQYKKIGERTIMITELRNMLNISKDQYLRFDHFETRVLKKAYSEINTKTEIRFEYEKIRKNRRVHAIKFSISKKKRKKTKNLILNESNSEAEKLNFYGVARAKAREMIEADVSKVREALESIKSQSSEIKNPAGWLVQYVEQGWKDSGKELVKNKKVKRKVQHKEEQEKLIVDQKESDKFKTYNRYVGQEVLEIIEQWNLETETKNWEILKKQKWRLIKSSVFPKQGIEKWTTFLNRDIVIEYLKTHHGLELLTQAELTEKE